MQLNCGNNNNNNNKNFENGQLDIEKQIKLNGSCKLWLLKSELLPLKHTVEKNNVDK